MKKLVIAIIILFAILIGIGACAVLSIDKAVEEVNEEIDNLEGCEVTIDECRIITLDEKPYAIVSFTFTNNSEENRAFYTTVKALAFQNGVEAENTYLLDENWEPVVNDNDSKEIKPNSSIVVECVYTLNDTVTPLEIEVSHWLFESDAKISKTFDLSVEY